MKTLTIFIFLLIPFNILASPKLFFSWTNIYDKMCARGFEYSKIDQEEDSEKLKLSWSIELKKRVPDFQKQWDEDSQALFKVLVTEFKKDFSRSEYTASLSACAPAPSMPDPLVLNVSRYLRAYRAPKEPKDMKFFVDIPFHELLHLWLFEHFPQDTPLKLKYKNEKIGVVSHIHLFAMESLIYEKANKLDIWKEVHDFHMRQGGIHGRAMEILDKEGRERILSELK
ncbi:MAG: hypothetical protein ACXVCP_19465 [Bdellovibrio sp.]